jgi:hypothetical protein
MVSATLYSPIYSTAVAVDEGVQTVSPQTHTP